jgi:hypothetical protein
MPASFAPNGPGQKAGRPFPWYFPKCRRKEVRPATIPYQGQRLIDGQPVTVTLVALTVPHCGELVFDYDADEQINEAFRLQTQGLVTGRDTGTEH